jgi:hypothetical protein
MRDETAGVGVDEATPVSNEYKERDNAFAGKIEKVVIDIQPMSPADAKENVETQGKANIRKGTSD